MPSQGSRARVLTPVSLSSSGSWPSTTSCCFSTPRPLTNAVRPSSARCSRCSTRAASIVGVHDWGTRRIAYEINHEPEANYQLFQFEGDNALLDRLNHSLRIMDGVIRFRIIRQKPGGPPVPPSPEQPRPQRDEEPTEGRVAARAAADAPPEQGSEETEPARRGVDRLDRRRARAWLRCPPRPSGAPRGIAPGAAAGGLPGSRSPAARITQGPRSFATYLRLARIRRHTGSDGKVVRVRLRELGGRADGHPAQHLGRGHHLGHLRGPLPPPSRRGPGPRPAADLGPGGQHRADHGRPGGAPSARAHRGPGDGRGERGAGAGEHVRLVGPLRGHRGGRLAHRRPARLRAARGGHLRALRDRRDAGGGPRP